MIFGEPSSYVPRHECETFHCEAGSSTAGSRPMAGAALGGHSLLPAGSQLSQLSQNASAKAALQGEHREQLKEERRSLRVNARRAQTA